MRCNGGFIVHRGASNSLVSQGKGTGLDYVEFRSETGCDTHRCPQVLRNIRLKKYDPHSKPR